MKKFLATFFKTLFSISFWGMLIFFFKIIIIDEYLLPASDEFINEELPIVTISETENDRNLNYESTYTGTETAVIPTQNNSSAQNVNYNKYYYSQLDNNAKLIYNAFEKNIENLKTGTYVIDMGKTFNDYLQQEGAKEELNISFQSALDAFKLDKPDVFFLDITKIFMTTTTRKVIKTTYEISFGPSNNVSYLNSAFASKADVDLEIQKINSIVGAISLRNDANDYSKIKSVHDWIINNVEYDTSISLPGIYEIWGALDRKTAVCEGYAKTFKYILDKLQIPSVIVKGIATNSSGETEAHAWNYVMLENSWYAVDTTWDDPVIIGDGKVPKNTKYQFFCKGKSTISKDHFLNGKMTENGMEFKYPVLSNSDY